MRMLLVIIIIILNGILAANVEISFPVSDIKDILKLEKTIKLEVKGTDSILIDIKQIEPFGNGYIVADLFKAKRVNYFDENGKYIKTVGRRGVGPKEFQKPYFCMVKGGNTLTICSHPPYKLLNYDKDLRYINECKVQDKLNFRPDMGLVFGSYFVFLTSPQTKSGKNIFITDSSYQIKVNCRDIEPLSKIISYEQPAYIVVGKKLWVTQKFNPYIEIFDIETGSRLKILGKELKRRDHCLYSDMLEDYMTKGDYSSNYKRFFKVTGTRAVPHRLININDKYIMHGSFYKIVNNKKFRFFDVYNSEGVLLQEHVPLKQTFKDKSEYFHVIPITTSKKLFLIDYNLNEEQEEDVSAIIYQYTCK